MSDFQLPQFNFPTIPNIAPNATGQVQGQDGTPTVPQSQEEARMPASNDKTVEELQTEINKLNNDKAENNKKMQQIQAQIDQKVAQLKENAKKAEELKEHAVERHQNEVDTVVKNNMKAYTEANKAGGKGMTRQELYENISKSMPNSPDLSQALARYVLNDQLTSEIDNLTGELNNLSLDNQLIDTDIKTKEAAKTAVQQALTAQQAQAQGAGSGNTVLPYAAGLGAAQANTQQAQQGFQGILQQLQQSIQQFIQQLQQTLTGALTGNAAGAGLGATGATGTGGGTNTTGTDTTGGGGSSGTLSGAIANSHSDTEAARNYAAATGTDYNIALGNVEAAKEASADGKEHSR